MNRHKGQKESELWLTEGAYLSAWLEKVMLEANLGNKVNRVTWVPCFHDEMQEYCMPHCSSHLDGRHVKPLTIPLSRDRRPIQGSVLLPVNSLNSLLQFLNSAFYIKSDISVVRHTVELVDYHPANLQACPLQPNLTDVRTVFDLVHPYIESESCSVVSHSLGPHGLYSPWNSPGQNTRVGSLSLPQEIFPTQGLNPGLPHCRQILYLLIHKASTRILEWVPILSAVDLPNPWIELGSPALQGDSLPNELWQKPYPHFNSTQNSFLCITDSLGCTAETNSTL